MKVLSSYEMRLSDEATILNNNISELTLMKNASKALFEKIKEKKIISSKQDNISVLCSHSNNSGDGFGLAKLLLDDGYENVLVYFIGDFNKMKPSAMLMYETLLSKYEENFIVINEDDFPLLEDDLLESNFIIDALIGIGVKGMLKPIIHHLVELINRSNAIKIAIDLPTGLNSDRGSISPVAVHADYTLVIQTYKTGHLLLDGSDYCGKCFLVDVGIEVPENISGKTVVDENFVRRNILKRKNNSNKYDYGSVLVIGSNVSMAGAGILSAKSALRSGCGLVTLAVPESNYNVVASKAEEEIMVKVLADNSLEFNELLRKKNVVVFGPGLGRDKGFTELLKYLLKLNISLIVDADGLYHLSLLANEIEDKVANLIITPHIGEACTLLDNTKEEVIYDLLASIRKLSENYGAYTVLKGHNTIVSTKKGDIYFSLTGNSGMATAGSGDVLSGVIAGMLAGGGVIGEKVASAVYIHGLSGDIAKKKFGEISLMAGDIIECLPEAFKCVLI